MAEFGPSVGSDMVAQWQTTDNGESQHTRGKLGTGGAATGESRPPGRRSHRGIGGGSRAGESRSGELEGESRQLPSGKSRGGGVATIAPRKVAPVGGNRRGWTRRVGGATT